MRLTKKGYMKRLIDDTIEENLNIFGAISIEEPKWCGKLLMVSLKLCKEETCKQMQENFIRDEFFEIANDTELMKNKNVKYVKKLCKFHRWKLTKLCEYDRIYCDDCLKFQKHH